MVDYVYFNLLLVCCMLYFGFDCDGVLLNEVLNFDGIKGIYVVVILLIKLMCFVKIGDCIEFSCGVGIFRFGYVRFLF